jgi:DNA-binding NarL/FixJ family response regulator
MIVDDFREWRMRLRSILELIPGFKVVAEAANGLEAIEKAGRLLPEIVFLDIGMPLLNGIEAAPRILRASPRSKVIFLTQEHDSEIRAAALATGAAAYLLKSTSVSELQRTLESVTLNELQTYVGDWSADTPSRSDIAAAVS